MWYTKEDFEESFHVFVTIVSIDFDFMVKKIRKFLVISSFMFQRKKKVIQVCNDMKEFKFLH